jgi:hypothetical protein
VDRLDADVVDVGVLAAPDTERAVRMVEADAHQPDELRRQQSSG